MAEAARSLVTAARAAGVQVSLVSARSSDARGTDVRFAVSIGTENPHPINVICINANETAALMDELGPGVTAGRYNVGFWFWELARFPAPWQGAVDRVDEIWVASRFVGETMAASTSKPVQTVRLAVDATPSRTYRNQVRPARYVHLLFAFNFSLCVAPRRSPDPPFRRAFPSRRQPVALILKSTNAGSGRGMRHLVEAIGGDERIQVIDRAMSRDEVFGLESVVDSYVSLHRSEGFGLGLAESMFLGKPVIGTGYSGNLEFMNQDNSLLVDYRLAPVGERDYPFPEGQVWAEPDEDQAADLMHRLVSDPEFGQQVGARARDHIRREFSAQAIGAGVAGRLSQILDGTP
jgi:glycosyltransferase involved in cell wall biosynthesis